MYRKKIIPMLFICFLWALVFFTMFFKLGSGAVCQADEATHGVNAYEMAQNDEWLVNTYKYDTDYFNSKPPLSLWMIMISYKLFGYTPFALRFASALFGFASCVLITLYLIKNNGMLSALFFAAAFPTMTALVEFHAFRAGDMDSIYCAFFALAMISLLEVKKGRKKYLILYGFALSLAIMTKGIHAGIIFLIGLLMLPQIIKKIDIKTTFLAFISAILIPAAWIFTRCSFDGTKFVLDAVLNEFQDKTSGRNLSISAYAHDILTSKCYWLLIFTIVVNILVLIIKSNKKNKDIIAWLKDRYPLILWSFIPFIMFSMTGTHYPWYIYPGYFGAVYFIATNAADIISIQKKPVFSIIFSIFIICFCLIVSSRQLQRLSYSGEGGSPSLQFDNALKEFHDTWGTKYNKRNVYIAYGNHIYGNENNWENNYVFYAETTTDFICKDGGLKGFMSDPDSLIIIDHNLWDKYSAYLTGYVILEDNGYTIFCHDKY
jgi:4-amino-4-deoxy-L-arabinose transferase-like glycosyltransferase